MVGLYVRTLGFIFFRIDNPITCYLRICYTIEMTLACALALQNASSLFTTSSNSWWRSTERHGAMINYYVTLSRDTFTKDDGLQDSHTFTVQLMVMRPSVRKLNNQSMKNTIAVCNPRKYSNRLAYEHRDLKTPSCHAAFACEKILYPSI